MTQPEPVVESFVFPRRLLKITETLLPASSFTKQPCRCCNTWPLQSRLCLSYPYLLIDSHVRYFLKGYATRTKSSCSLHAWHILLFFYWRNQMSPLITKSFWFISVTRAAEVVWGLKSKSSVYQEQRSCGEKKGRTIKRVLTRNGNRCRGSRPVRPVLCQWSVWTSCGSGARRPPSAAKKTQTPAFNEKKLLWGGVYER